MKTKTTLFGSAALLAFSLSMNAQNVSIDLDLIPLPGSGMNNTALGRSSLLNLTNGDYNTAAGLAALSNNMSGFGNSALGYASLGSNANSNFNSAFGFKCLDGNQNDFNTAMGAYSMNNNQNGTYNATFGFMANVATNNLVNASAIGANAIVNANDRIWLGDISTDVWTSNSFNVSDGRFKKNIDAAQVKGLDFIKLLRPVTYNFDGKGFTDYVTKNMTDENRKKYLAKDFSHSDNILQTGFIAQEVEMAAKASGYNFSGVHAPEGSTDTYGISYYQFVVPLVKAVQEQQAIIENLQQQVAQLQKSSGTTGINQQNGIGNFTMEQNEPNPFTHETVVRYNLPEQINTAYMAVYDLSGKQLATFPITQKGAGSVTLSSEKLSAGIYLYSIVADGKVFDSKKMIVAEK